MMLLLFLLLVVSVVINISFFIVMRKEAKTHEQHEEPEDLLYEHICLLISNSERIIQDGNYVYAGKYEKQQSDMEYMFWLGNYSGYLKNQITGEQINFTVELLRKIKIVIQKEAEKCFVRNSLDRMLN